MMPVNNSDSLKRKKKILIVDDHAFVRQGLRDYIEREPEFTVCGEAASRVQSLRLCSQVSPDLVLVDISLGRDSGLDLLKDIAAQFPGMKTLALSMRDEMLYAERALRAGASGYVGKDAPPARLIDALHCVFEGGIYASESVKQKIMQAVRSHVKAAESPVERLSDRELAVFERIGGGQSTAEIAEVMSLSIKTVETYRARIKNKLNISNSSELVQLAVQWGLNRSV
ncbi:MAG: hypothetical protein PWQ29_770 [Verrucomicrobiota bacterium]|jgi:DNA-binding NarL/FixJ family response regulator|nr:hypothetical protein [Verrucomicrobiota bacterium]MDK2963376.1 hypothetical protein [Verrucomicrobiota bacterium]